MITILLISIILLCTLLQDIFECRTCGLTGSLCCCTECARVCHKGHDCKLKRTSPTAYCDCWEKCKCKALIQGSQTSRYDLLCRLISDTNLVSQHNSRSILFPLKLPLLQIYRVFVKTTFTLEFIVF